MSSSEDRYSNLRNRADHVIMSVNQSFSFRRFSSANYFSHSAFPQITHTPEVLEQLFAVPSDDESVDSLEDSDDDTSDITATTPANEAAVDDM